MLPIGVCSQLACIWETTARCPGNAHRYRDFTDTSYVDFLTSAAVTAGVLDNAPGRPVGQTVLDGVRATRAVVNANTNLGVLLLLAPLASVPTGEDLRQGVELVLDTLTLQDSRAVYEAIRLANPAGLGEVPEQDIKEEPTESLRRIMTLASERDLVARQYANGYLEVFEEGIPALRHCLTMSPFLEEAIVYCHLTLMARFPDSLIARKRGPAEAVDAARQAQQVLDHGWPMNQAARAALSALDGWLRGADRGRNPGTTSDLVTASLFAALREGIIKLPCRFSQAPGSDS
ncbi:MAG TPA: triphosphoribosyl-dephospho-CoA synthase [Gemmataceae bacterium]|nr:triphosphoribosyl-dephospho-CoA synthase [Gemmataceae bacterium]